MLQIINLHPASLKGNSTNLHIHIQSSEVLESVSLQERILINKYLFRSVGVVWHILSHFCTICAVSNFSGIKLYIGLRSGLTG